MARHRADDRDPHQSKLPDLPGESSGDYPAHRPSRLPSKHFNPEEPPEDEGDDSSDKRQQDDDSSGKHRQPGSWPKWPWKK